MSGRSRSVLVVDDSAVVRLTLCRRLRAEGLSVVEHESAKSAEMHAPTNLACGVLDLDLGDGDGVSLAQALWAIAPKLPIAFFSGGTMRDLEARARALAPVFSKPDEIDILVAWVLARVNVTVS